METTDQILCIGAVLWDVIGRTPAKMGVGYDVAGRITRLPGGVALNVAMALKRAGLSPALLSAVGQDAAGAALLQACDEMGLDISAVYRAPHLATDQYMAIEGENGLIAAIADAHSLEDAGDAILKPLQDGDFGAPFTGFIVLDGNLTEDLLSQIASDPAFAHADLRVAPASPGKVRRLLPLLAHPNLTLYINRLEVGLLHDRSYTTSTEAAQALCDRGVARAVVTDGATVASVAQGDTLLTGTPPKVKVLRVTGAGDTFMASHISAEHRGLRGEAALNSALSETALYVSGDTQI